jgi:hypothetical protein
MCHLIGEGNRHHPEGTPFHNSWYLYHDALKTWWEPEAQSFLPTFLGFATHRQLRITDPHVPAAYFEKVCGNSMEFSRGLDSFGFSRFKKSVGDHVALSQAYIPLDDHRRFGAGTPKELQSTMERVWQVSPSRESIVKDILDFPRVLQLIKAAQGIAVDDLAIRHGKRATSTSVKNARPECSTGVMECHQDLHPAIQKLLATANGAVDTRPIFQRSVALCSHVTRTCIGCQSFFRVDVSAFDVTAAPVASTAADSAANDVSAFDVTAAPVASTAADSAANASVSSPFPGTALMLVQYCILIVQLSPSSTKTKFI